MKNAYSVILDIMVNPYIVAGILELAQNSILLLPLSSNASTYNTLTPFIPHTFHVIFVTHFNSAYVLNP